MCEDLLCAYLLNYCHTLASSFSVCREDYMLLSFQLLEIAKNWSVWLLYWFGLTNILGWRWSSWSVSPLLRWGLRIGALRHTEPRIVCLSNLVLWTVDITRAASPYGGRLLSSLTGPAVHSTICAFLLSWSPSTLLCYSSSKGVNMCMHPYAHFCIDRAFISENSWLCCADKKVDWSSSWFG